MRAVPAADLLNGVLSQVVSRRSGAPLSDVVIVTGPTARIPTWFPLVADDVVEVHQAGCSAPAASAPVRVDPLPAPLPSPAVRGPVRPGTRAVVVEGRLPGSRVHLLVEWVERSATDQTWTGEAVLQLGQALTEGQRLWAVQTMCTASSVREGPPVVVARGGLGVDVSPDSVPGGEATSIVVRARDVETGEVLPGLPVLLGGTAVGVAATAFGWTAPTSGTSVGGTVKGGTAYQDAAFTLALRQAVPVNLTLFPGPVVIPNKVSQSDVVWTLTPRWAGASAVMVNGNARRHPRRRAACRAGAHGRDARRQRPVLARRRRRAHRRSGRQRHRLGTAPGRRRPALRHRLDTRDGDRQTSHTLGSSRQLAAISPRTSSKTCQHRSPTRLRHSSSRAAMRRRLSSCRGPRCGAHDHPMAVLGVGDLFDRATGLEVGDELGHGPTGDLHPVREGAHAHARAARDVCEDGRVRRAHLGIAVVGQKPLQVTVHRPLDLAHAYHRSGAGGSPVRPRRVPAGPPPG